MKRFFANTLGRPSLLALLSVLVFSASAMAGSLAPSASPASTMRTLAEIYNAIAGTFDSSAITANQNGSLLETLKYLENQVPWASSSNNIWSLNSGNVGIGTSSLDAKLEVSGVASVSSLLIGGSVPRFVTSNSLDFDEFAASMTLDTDITISNNGYALTLGNASISGNFELGSNGFFWNGTNVGIGTSRPDAKLEVAGTASISNSLYVISGGNVGIGTSAPTEKLHLSVDDATTNAVTDVLRLQHLTTGTAANSIGAGILFSSEDSTGTAEDIGRISGIFSNATHGAEAGALTFSTRNTAGIFERMRIASDGTVGIGTTVTSTAGLAVRTTAVDGLSVIASGNAGGSTGYGFYLEKSGTGGTNYGIYASVSGASGTNRAAYFKTTDSSTTSVTEILSLVHDSNVAGGNGNGASLVFYGEDTIGSTEEAGSIAGLLTNATHGAEVGAIILTPRGSGNVGIGTSTPKGKLTVVGTSAEIIASGSSYPALVINATNATNGTQGLFKIQGQSTDETLGIINGAGTTLMTIASGGNVGIGSTAPTAKLSLGTSAGAAALHIYQGGAGSNYGMGIQFSNNYQFFTSNGTFFTFNGGGNLQTVGAYEMMRVSASGVGIGVTSPAARLDVMGSQSTDPFNVASSSGTSILRVSKGGNVGINDSTPTTTLDVAGSASISGSFEVGTSGFWTNGTNVGIGNNRPDQKLDVAGNITASTSGNVDVVLRSSTITGTNDTDGGKFTLRSASGLERFDIVGSVPDTMNSCYTPRVSIASSGFVGIYGRTHCSYVPTTPAALLELKISNAGESGLGDRMLSIESPAQGPNTVGAYIKVNAQVGGTILRLEDQSPTGGTPSGILLDVLGDVQGDGVDTDLNRVFQIANGSGAAYFYGNVGMGTLSPVARLDVRSSISGNYDLLNVASSSGTSYLRINKAGNVGISNSTPTTTLDVTGNASISGNFELGSNGFFWNGTNVGIGTSRPDAKLEVNGTASISNSLYVISGGNVGIGTSTPGAPLEVLKTQDGANSELIKLQNNGSGANTGTSIGLYLGGTLAGQIAGNYVGGFQMQLQSGTTSLDIDSSGPVHVTNTGANNAQMYIGTSAALAVGNTAEVIFGPGTGFSTALGPRLYGYLESISEAGLRFDTYNSGRSTRMVITGAGNVGISATTPEQTLTVAGNILASSSGNVDFILRSNTTNGATNNDDSQFTLRTGSTSERFDIINGAGAKLFSIASAGNVGIGTTSPRAQVDVVGALPVLVASKSTGTDNASGTGTNDSLYVQGRYLYTVNLAAGNMEIYDVSNPAVPTLVSSTSSGAGSGSIHVQGNYAYIGIECGDVLVYDVSNPARPVRTGSVTPNACTEALQAQGRYLYTHGILGNGYTNIIDISNPSAPTLVSSYNNLNNDSRVTMFGKYLFGAENIFDVSNPASMSRVFTNSTGGFGDITPSGRYAYGVLGTTFRVYDISNIASPSTVGTLSGFTNGGRLPAIQGRYAYVVSPNSGGASTLYTVDISAPTAPRLVSTVATLGVTASKPIVQGRYLYVKNRNSSSFHIYDLGGGYVQQIETGSIESSGLSVRGGARIGQDLELGGALSVGRTSLFNSGLAVTGNLSVVGSRGNFDAFNVASASGTSLFRISKSGFIGINDSTPTTTLDVAGSASVSGNFELTGASSKLGINAGGLINTTLEVGGTASISGIAYFGGNIGIGTTSVDAKLEVNGTASISNSLYVISGGNVGIASGSPQATLHVAPTSTGQVAIFEYANAGTSTNGVLIRQKVNTGGYNLRVDTGTATNFYVGVGSSPLVSVGSTSGVVGLTVHNSGALFTQNNGSRSRITIPSNGGGEFPEMYFGTAANTQKFTVGVTSGNAGFIRTNTAADMYLGTNDTTVLSITSLGNVGIGDTTPDARFDITGSAGNYDILDVASSSGTSFFRVAKGGNVGIGTTTPTSKLQIVGGNCADDAGGGGCTADYAEFYPSTEDMQKGDLVMIDTATTSYAVKKATSAGVAIGIVSTNPAITIDGGSLSLFSNAYVLNPRKPAVALKGRVPLKVIGTIAPGDWLTVSDTPGYAQKATMPGMVVGVALEASRDGKVLTFVSPTWWSPTTQGESLVAIDAPTMSSIFNAMIQMFADVLHITFSDGLVKIRSVELETGATIKDKATGQPYCVQVEYGQLVTSSGPCGSGVTPTPTLEPIPATTPTPTPEVTPASTPESAPEITPEATPTPTPTPIPEVVPTPVPEPTPEVTPEPVL